MKNPFKQLNPNLNPPAKLEKGLFQKLSLVKLLLNLTKLFTSDMVKTGAQTIDGIKTDDQDQRPNSTGANKNSNGPASENHSI